MFLQALEPLELVVELGSRRGIAIREIEASDQNAGGLCLDIAAMPIVRIAGQDTADLDRIGTARKDRYAVEALLAVPDDAVARLANRSFGKLVVRDLQFLKADDGGPGFGEPAQKVRQAGEDTVHVKRSDLQSSILSSLMIIRPTRGSRRLAERLALLIAIAWTAIFRRMIRKRVLAIRKDAEPFPIREQGGAFNRTGRCDRYLPCPPTPILSRRRAPL